MGRLYRFIIGASEAGLRLDRFLTRHLPSELSRSMMQRAIRKGLVTVDGRTAKPHTTLHPENLVIVQLGRRPAPPEERVTRPQPLPLEIVHEDEDLLIVNKPPGLVTHPAPGHWEGTLVNAILWHLQPPQETQKAHHVPELIRAGIIHRLDKDTSGLLVAAKTAVAHASLSRQLKARTLRRQYLALVEGHLPLDVGTVDAAIGRHLIHRKVMTVRHLGGRRAVTHYRVLRRLVPSEGDPATLPIPCSFIGVALETGRTHQIRVHLSHLGHPVVGDTTYGHHPSSYWQAIGVPRQLLHAYRLSFHHPKTGQERTVTAPLPADMRRWLGEDLGEDPMPTEIRQRPRSAKIRPPQA